MTTKHYFEHTPKASSDINQTENLAVEVEKAFLEVERDLANDFKDSASIGSSIGNLDTDYLKYYTPDNGLIVDYVQELYFPEGSKEASLDLIPDKDILALNNASIKNKLNPAQIYTYKHDGLLISDTDFTFINRKVIIGKSPTVSNILSISYNGYEPVDQQDEGLDLRYNVLQVKDSSGVTKEFEVEKAGLRYTVSGYNFRNMCSRDIVKIIDNKPYNLDKYVSVYSATQDKVYTISNINIDNSSFSFDSEDNITGKIKIYIANSTISKLIEGLYRLFYAHDHGSNGSKLVNHKDLTGLFNNSSKVFYKTTNKENYDHPQYLNREGYTESPEVYNNAMLGDLLLGSTDNSNYYNNLSDNSFKLIFGEYSSGHRLGYNKQTDSLVINSLSKNGVKLISPKNKNILEVNDHIITDLVDGDYTGLRVSIAPTTIADKELAVFSIKTVRGDGIDAVHTDDAELHVNSSTFSLSVVKDELNVLNNAIIKFGTDKGVTALSCPQGVLFEDKTEAKDQSVIFNLTVKAGSVFIDNLNAKGIHITDDQVITFGNASTDGGYSQYLRHNSSSDEVEISTNNPVKLVKNGYNSGIKFSTGNKIFSSVSLGNNTSTVGEKLDTYIQSSGNVYFIDGTSSYTVGVTSLTSVNRSDIFSKTLTSDNIKINYNALATNGLSLNGDTHKIFAQKDVQGNIGTNLLSTGGVNILSGYTINNNSSVLSYGVLRASEFRSEGGGDSAGFYGNVIIPSSNKLIVNGEAQINSNLAINTNFTVKGISTLNNLETTNVKATSIAATDSITTPLITSPLGYDSKIYVGSDIIFNNAANFKQVCTFTSNCDFNSIVKAPTIIVDNLTVSSSVNLNNLSAKKVVVEDTLQFKNMLQSDSSTTSVFSGAVNLKKNLTLDRNTSIVLGSPDIETTRNTSGVYITENEVKLGNNSSIRSNRMSSNKGVPTGNNGSIVGGYTFETSNGVTDTTTGFFSTNKGNTALAEDLVFCINGVQKGVISSDDLDLNGSISGREKTLVTADMLKSQFDNIYVSILDKVYPVGSIYLNATDNRNPKEILSWGNSVWTRMVGMTLVGAEGSAGSEKMPSYWNKPSDKKLEIEMEFGEWAHQLTVNETPSNMLNGVVTADGFAYAGDSGRGGGSALINGKISGVTGVDIGGKNYEHNNTQPSKVVGMWRRVG